MVSRGKLTTWQAAGLIDAATVARIEAWEAERARPLGLWALVTLGALAVGLAVTLAALLAGLRYFRHAERELVDVI